MIPRFSPSDGSQINAGDIATRKSIKQGNIDGTCDADFGSLRITILNCLSAKTADAQSVSICRTVFGLRLITIMQRAKSVVYSAVAAIAQFQSGGKTRRCSREPAFIFTIRSLCFLS